MAIASTIEAVLPFVLAAGAVGGLSLSVWPVLFPRLALAFLFLSLMAGQLWRLPLPGQGGGLLLSDAAVVWVLLASFRRFYIKRPSQGNNKAAQPLLLILPFIIWSLLGLIVNFSSLETGGLVIAFSYWVRLTAYLLLLPALIFLLRPDESLRKFALKGLIATVLTISLLGVLQVWLWPDLSFLAEKGWDPHQRRVVSTWLDPNLLAGLLVMSWPLIIWVAGNKSKYGYIYLTLTALPALALLLTKSRSGLVALAGMALVLSPLWLMGCLRQSSSAKVKAKATTAVSLFVMTMLIVSAATFVLGERSIGLLRGDATVRLRVDALALVWPMAEKYSLFGTGYNAYQFAALEAGVIGDFNIHSRGGSDNSLLTLWVTTGITGIVLWLLPWLFYTHVFIKNWLEKKEYLSLIAVAGFASLLIHSQFVNSLLYGHLLIVLILVFALAYSEIAINQKDL